MSSKVARRLLFALGFLCGLCAVTVAAAVLLALASNSGAGWQSRHRLSKGDLG